MTKKYECAYKSGNFICPTLRYTEDRIVALERQRLLLARHLSTIYTTHPLNDPKHWIALVAIEVASQEIKENPDVGV